MTKTQRLKKLRDKLALYTANLTKLQNSIQEEIHALECAKVKIHFNEGTHMWQMDMPEGVTIPLPNMERHVTNREIWFSFGTVLSEYTANSGHSYGPEDIEILYGTDDDDILGPETEVVQGTSPGELVIQPVEQPVAQPVAQPCGNAHGVRAEAVPAAVYKAMDMQRTGLRSNGEVSIGITDAIRLLIDHMGIGVDAKLVLGGLAMELQRSHRTCQQAFVGKIKLLLEWYSHSDSDMRNEDAVAWCCSVSEMDGQAGNLGMEFPYL